MFAGMRAYIGGNVEHSPKWNQCQALKLRGDRWGADAGH